MDNNTKIILGIGLTVVVIIAIVLLIPTKKSSENYSNQTLAPPEPLVIDPQLWGQVVNNAFKDVDESIKDSISKNLTKHEARTRAYRAFVLAISNSTARPENRPIYADAVNKFTSRLDRIHQNKNQKWNDDPKTVKVRGGNKHAINAKADLHKVANNTKHLSDNERNKHLIHSLKESSKNYLMSQALDKIKKN